ncbi:hypothetical protein Theco_4088 (plasmid) [Thermobacillus composti KWC4]|uniref:Uncharacterized protein n=1 Tax=Thermobacillus composti (strain DSM 18247 / JCM 13945 / KWC4) TaxID=717605 RepID=L0EKM2_THECK|nr:hypothetical protein [Thermobacillus composti]AGA60087.1 hypothetical protein Theco_4088 [Thermobacillus composti KWC4]
MGTKIRVYLEFLLQRPSRPEIDKYKADLTVENRKLFDHLLLFCYFDLIQYTREKKLVSIGDFYLSCFGLFAIIVGLAGASYINHYLGLSMLWFINLALGLIAGGWAILIWRKHYFFASRPSLWKATIRSNLQRLHDNPEEFEATFRRFIMDFPEKSVPKWNKLIPKLIGR